MLGMKVGLDLGSSAITAYVAGKGIVLCEANAISYDSYSGDVLAVGSEAMAMLSRTPESSLTILSYNVDLKKLLGFRIFSVQFL